MILCASSGETHSSASRTSAFRLDLRDGPIALRGRVDVFVDHDTIGILARDLIRAVGGFRVDHAKDVVGPFDAFHAAGQPIAGALPVRSPRVDVVLLEYIAVHPDFRGHGIGSALLRAETPRWNQDTTLVLAEVEDPRGHQPSQYGDPTARLRLYDNVGARLLPLRYFQPALRPDVARVPDMLLLALGDRPDEAECSAVVGFLDEYFTGTEGAEAVRRDADYLALRQAASAWPSGRIPLLPLARLGELPTPGNASPGNAPPGVTAPEG